MPKRKTTEDRYRNTRSELDELHRWFLDQYVSLGQATALIANGNEKAAGEILDSADTILRVINYALGDGCDALQKQLKKN